MSRTQTDIKVHVLNLLPLVPLEQVRNVMNDPDITGINMDTYGVVMRDDEPFALLDTEGVGRLLKDEEKVYFDFYVRWEKSLSAWPSGQVGVKTCELPQLFSEVQGLATFIRTFGSRLEANYERWRRELDPVEA